MKTITDINQAALFDMQEKVAETHELNAQFEALTRRTGDVAIRIGENLLYFKDRLPHGKFLLWVETEFGMTPRTAQRFMAVALKFSANATTWSHLGWRVLSELTSVPDTVIDMVETGEIPATIPAILEAKQEVQREEAERDLQREPAPAIHPTLVAYTPRTPPLENVIHPLTTGYPPLASPIDEAREIRREQAKERIEQLRGKGADVPVGTYSCLVVDPPWPMQKIERDVRPNQVEFDYPTMTEEELKSFPLPDLAADDAHLYLWTTQKYLPMALRLAEHWGFKYQCLMTWVKNVGFTPFSWMYSTEHILFCTRGSLPLLRMGMRLDFSAKVREHSRKPDTFYDIVREVSPGPRIDVFSREKREGFEQYGNEVGKYVSAGL